MQKSTLVDFRNGRLTGQQVEESLRTLGDLDGIFLDELAYRSMNHASVVYRVQAFQPVGNGVEGGLFWGTTFLEPGRVGDEYFMTKGHFHAKPAKAEYYVTVCGSGALILMDEGRASRVEWMTPGSVHYIPGRTAHRVANIGEETLSFLACWPSDAGHDYATIATQGFSARMRCIDGRPRLVEAT
ncbi:MAG: glucose-6-phosphate isomerase family protein [Candidatus Acidiferrales bacterium]